MLLGKPLQDAFWMKRDLCRSRQASRRNEGSGVNRKEKTIAVTIVANLVLVGLKYGLAALSGSLALRASAWHSFGDVFVSLFVLVGLFTTRWEAGRRGGQISVVENAVALVVSGFIFYIAYGIFREVVSGADAPDLRNLWPVTAAALLTIAITYFTARYKEYVGRATGSPSLIASAYHSRMDLYASVLVVAGLAVSALGLEALDRLTAVVVIAFILLAGWEIASSALAALLSGGVLHLEEDGIAHIRRHGWRLARVIVAALVVFALSSGFYTVQLGSRGIVRRFGRVAAQVGPGLHYRIPVIDGLNRVAMDQVRQVQTGRALMLTGDTNLIQVRLNLHYTVTDPVAYLFSARRVEELVAQEAEAAIRQAVATRSVDDLLSVGRAAILTQALSQTQALLDEHKVGTRVTALQLLEVTPPPEVAASFRDVASAREDRNTYINEAEAYRNEIVPAARGEAAKAVRAARAEAQRKVDVARGEADRFLKQLAAYRTAPVITRTRLYIETLERVLPAVSKFILDPSVQTDTTDLWFGNGPSTPPPSGNGQ